MPLGGHGGPIGLSVILALQCIGSKTGLTGRYQLVEDAGRRGPGRHTLYDAHFLRHGPARARAVCTRRVPTRRTKLQHELGLQASR